MNDLVSISGIVKDFERTTHTSGARNHTSTTHISIFRVNADRVMLRTVVPGNISDGDQVVLAGSNANGQFNALACKNLTANWTSPLKQQGCAFAALICMAIFSFLMFFMILPIFFGGVCLFFAIKVKKHDNTLKQAHQMVQDAY